MTHGASIYKSSAPCRHIVITLCYCKYVFLLGLHKFTYALKLSWDGKPLPTMLVRSITIADICAVVSLNRNGDVRVVEEGGHIRRGGGAGIERLFLALSVAHSVRVCGSRCATQSGSIKL